MPYLGTRDAGLLPALAVLLLAVLNACTATRPVVTEPPIATPPPARPEVDGAPPDPVDFDAVPDAVPRAEPFSRYGNPPFYFQDGKRYEVMASNTGYVERGIASWYGTKFHGQRTSSGEPYDLYGMTAAHKTLPLPTYVQVTNLHNGRRIIVRVNDRGPFKDNRVIDLSYVAAGKLGILPQGTGVVEIQAIDPTAPAAPPHIVAPAAPATPPANLYLQIGAFTNPQNAERMRTRVMRSMTSEVRVMEGYSANNGRVYRVRLGPIASVEDADRMAEKLQGLGIRDTRIVVD